MRYAVRYVHKISPRDTDTAGPITLNDGDLASKTVLAAALRKQRILSRGDQLNSFRVDPDGKIVAFPKASVWWSIIMTPVAENPLGQGPRDVLIVVGVVGIGALLYELTKKA